MLTSERCRLVGDVVGLGSRAFIAVRCMARLGISTEKALTKVGERWGRGPQFVRYVIRMWSHARAGTFDAGTCDEPMTIEQAEIAAGVRNFDGRVRPAWQSVVPEEYGLVGAGGRLGGAFE